MNDERARELQRVVASFGSKGCTAAEFAATAYADSPAWRKAPRRRGGQRGGLIVRSSAGVLGQLRRGGFVRKASDGRYVVAETPRASVDPEAAVSGAALPSTAAAHSQAALSPAAGPQYVWAPGWPYGVLVWDRGCYFWTDGIQWFQCA